VRNDSNRAGIEHGRFGGKRLEAELHALRAWFEKVFELGCIGKMNPSK
jgi:hypothetical protein